MLRYIVFSAMDTKVFYVVCFADQGIEDCLQAIRLLCNPKAKWRPHITVRGPYKRKYNLEAAARKIKGSRISIHHAGTFFAKNQHTVFLKCVSDALRAIWKKPDFAGYVPHLTLYDGDSREFATALFERLESMDLHFDGEAEGLMPIESQKGQYALPLDPPFASEIVSTAIGKPLDRDTLDGLPLLERLSFIERLLLTLAPPKPQQNHMPQLTA